jgi:hypothetical protein
MKNSNDIIGNQTHNLAACSTVPQPTAPPHAPEQMVQALNEFHLFCFVYVYVFFLSLSLSFIHYKILQEACWNCQYKVSHASWSKFIRNMVR